MNLELEGKVALITGGAQGFGRAICEGLAQEGVSIAVNYFKNKDVLDETMEILSKYGVKTFAVEADVSKEEEVKAMFKAVIGEFGHIDILVNNAGICPLTSVLETTIQTWNAVMAVNLTSVFLTSKEMALHLIDRKSGGRIVNIASQAAYNGSKSGKSHYAASKGGVVTFTNSFAKEVAKYGINITGIAPGLIYTDMTAELIDANLEKYKANIPIGRISLPKEVAKMVTIMASDAASYVTGTTVDLSGGMIGR